MLLVPLMLPRVVLMMRLLLTLLLDPRSLLLRLLLLLVVLMMLKVKKICRGARCQKGVRHARSKGERQRGGERGGLFLGFRVQR